ncbi:MAG: alpha/beta fold hydrolase [bacterium]|nr:alpha/beta fold hydrolase [bacterium]
MTDYLHPLVAPFSLEGDGDDTILLLHGWTGSPAQLRPLATVLNEHGYPVVAPLLAGHGTSPQDMAGTGWRDWMRSAAEPAAEIISGGQRLHLIGLSMGGVISLLLAPIFGASSVTTINTPQRVWDRRNKLATIYRGSHRIDIGEPSAPFPPEVREFDQGYIDTPVGTAAELGDLMVAAGNNLHRVTCPALVIQSRTDETVKPVSGEIIFDGLGSSEKGLVWLEDSRHVAVLDVERDIIADAILDHLETAISDQI